MGVDSEAKKPHNKEVNKAGMPAADKTGLVLKISIVLFVLLATVVYKLNDYFKDEKNYSMQARLRGGVVLVKTTVGSQLAQLRNTLSAYEIQLDESTINWVQLDPFYVIAVSELNQGKLNVQQMQVRSGTPAERWNAAFLERALTVNMARQNRPVLAQLFQDKAGSKFLVLRFKTSVTRELILVGDAIYFQKFFDIERGEKSTSLLATSENMLAAHSVADYIGSLTEETALSPKKYLVEKEEISGTNLLAVSYAPKSRVSGGFAVPWSVAGVVAGFGCILLAVIFYSLDPLEKRIARYKKQEREQIYKDTLGSMTAKTSVEAPIPPPPPPRAAPAPIKEEPIRTKAPAGFYAIETQPVVASEVPVPEAEDFVMLSPAETILEEEVTHKKEITSESFLTLDDEKMDLSDIEKALALDDFDDEVLRAEAPQQAGVEALRLERNLTPQKISLSPAGAPVVKPDFAMTKKEFESDAFKVNIRRPEKS